MAPRWQLYKNCIFLKDSSTNVYSTGASEGQASSHNAYCTMGSARFKFFRHALKSILTIAQLISMSQGLVCCVLLPHEHTVGVAELSA